MPTLEERLAVLEQSHLDQHVMYMFLTNCIIRSNDSLRIGIAEAIRLVIQNPVASHPVSDGVRDQLRSLRDDLLQAPSAAITATVSQPPVRPV